MSINDESVPVSQVRGRREMKELALAALSALAEAEMQDQVDELYERIFSLGRDAIADSATVEENISVWSFKPMVELVLQEVRDVASDPSLSPRTRRERIAWALHSAGF